ncbi:MAG: flagellar hook-length control protein FliK [Bacillota bacterium]|nr:flagellar hook-length control protein FliK [Bacillota bacterium]
MINQNYLMSILKVAPTIPNDVKAWSSSEKSDSASFKDFLGTASAKVQSDKQTLEQDKAPVQKPDFKTFRDAEQNRNVEAVQQKSTNDISKVKNFKEAQDNQNQGEKDSENKPDKVLESLSGLLGMNPQDLNKLLEKLNIKPENLADPSKAAEAVDKLSTIMGLGDDQKKVLSELIELVNKQLNVGKAEINTDPNSLKAADTGSDASKVSPPQQNGQTVQASTDAGRNTAELNELLQKLNGQIQQLTTKFNNDPQKFLEEMTSKVKAFVQQDTKTDAKASVQTTQDSGKKAEPEVKPDNAQQNNAQDTDAQGTDAQNADKKSENLAIKNNDKADASKAVEPAKQESSLGNATAKVGTATDTTQINSLSQVQNQNQVQDVVKLVKETPISKSEIVNQVIEKAKVLTTGDKSEMVVDLKPDNLGKVSLKVVTERGMVMAKFVAESQQVKEVLESNMQLLKDALEKQGLSVQGFSVSVGQNSSQGFSENQRFQPEKSSITGSTQNTGGINTASAAGMEVLQQRNNPYEITTNSINLTA